MSQSIIVANLVFVSEKSKRNGGKTWKYRTFHIFQTVGKAAFILFCLFTFVAFRKYLLFLSA